MQFVAFIVECIITGTCFYFLGCLRGWVQLEAADLMPPTRCQPNLMPGQLDAKPTFNSLTFKLLFTNPNPNPNQLPGIELVASSWQHQVGPFPA